MAIVLSHLGSPTAESWPELNSLPDYNKITFPYHKGVLWERIVPDALQEAVDLIKNILIYDSSKRMTAEEVNKLFLCIFQNKNRASYFFK